MPRVRQISYNSPVKTTTVPLSDDKAEKARRLQSRKDLQHKQTDELKAAASPARKRRSLGAGPNTPNDHDDEDSYGVRGDAVTPMKRVPILANFEEWMKMATDNKINAANSWNFALIDYFHDLSLLREGDSVNFQKASCTLDGCVKIYTSRVDSVVTETGKLLSGLADSGNKHKRGGEEGEPGEDGDDGDDGDDGEDGGKKKGRKKAQRSAEATLVATFEQIQLKKMELEFSVDPLFKKAAADFDEGGAKGLLMNHLSIDGTGRIVFDSSDDVDEDDDFSRRDSLVESAEDEYKKDQTPEPVEIDQPVDICRLAERFFPDLGRLEEQDICPSLRTFELGSSDDVTNLPFLKAPENWREGHPDDATEGNDGNQANFNTALGGDGPVFGDDDDEAEPAEFDLPPETGFGEGGEAWARDTALQPQMRVSNQGNAIEGTDEGCEVGTFDTNSNSYGVTIQHRTGENEHEKMLSYFDEALQKNWAGPEHWKIARIKEATRPQTEKRARKEKEPFEIDFAGPMSAELANALYTSASSNSAISLPRNQWRSKTRNLLPDDKHFNSKDLLQLFLKPKARIGSRKSALSRKPISGPDGEVDEAYWATHASSAAQQKAAALHPMDDDAVVGEYDANFFQDDNLPMPGVQEDDDDDAFADAREQFSPAADEIGAAGPEGAGIDSIAAGGAFAAGQEGAFGVNLVTQSRRSRPEYVQYARVAKKVDVRRLKENMWQGIGLEVRSETPTAHARPQIPQVAKDDHCVLKFTDIMNNLQHVYPKQQMQDISTSYGFICLLHLANEKGLVIENVQGWQDLTVRKDFTAVDLDAAV